MKRLPVGVQPNLQRKLMVEPMREFPKSVIFMKFTAGVQPNLQRKLMVEPNRERCERMLFICYPSCTTCQKARKWLDAHHIPYEIRDIKTHNPSQAELRQWHRQSGLPLKRFFNTSGLQYKALALKDKLSAMTEEEQFALLSTDGMLVKRPIFIGDELVLTGFKETEWAQALAPGDL
jgi:arsenate reductase